MSKVMWLLGAALGAALAYFFDPQSGTRRRTMLTDRLGGTTSTTLKRVQQQVQRTGDAGQGTIREAVRTGPRDNPDPDDRTLNDRVESEVFRDDRIPKGKLNTSVVDGVVELRGELDNQGDIDYVIECVKRVPDVKDVRSYLHTPGTAAPNKESAIEAS